MSDDNEQDEFDGIVNNPNSAPDSEQDESPELEHIWDAVQHIWPHFYPGYLIKGMLLAEYLDPEDGKVLRFVTSPEVTPWEMLGMLESARLDARMLSSDATLDTRYIEEDDDENDQ